VVICEGTYSTFGFDSKIQAEAHLKERGFHRTGADENRWSKDNIYVRVKEVNEPKPPESEDRPIVLGGGLPTSR
jgi:hypothetical protein